MMSFILSALFLSQFSFSQSVEVDVKLSPAGSFTAKTSDVTGEALYKGDSVMASNVKVNLKSLKTGIELRDEHTLKHLDVANHPEAVLIKAMGKGGKGKAKIKLRGKEKMVEGTYKISGDKKKLDATFPIALSEFDITGIKYMGVGVKDQVTVRLQLPLKEAAAGGAPAPAPAPKKK